MFTIKKHLFILSLFLMLFSFSSCEQSTQDIGEFKVIGETNYAYKSINGVKLDSGEVLIFSSRARNPVTGKFIPRQVTELYSPKTKTFKVIPSPKTSHSSAILLDNGKVLFFGGGCINETAIDCETAYM